MDVVRLQHESERAMNERAVEHEPVFADRAGVAAAGELLAAMGNSFPEEEHRITFLD
jgi:hypothetical protein